MNFQTLKSRVERAENLVDGRLVQTRDRHAALTSSWKQAWTPPRIVLAGLVSGLVAGSTQPTAALRRVGKLGGPKSLQMISALAGLLTSVQAAFAAATATKAANTADEAADTAGEAAESADVATTQAQTQTAPTAAAAAAPPPMPTQPAPVNATPTDRRRVEPVYTQQPAAAEAATEISETGR